MFTERMMFLLRDVSLKSLLIFLIAGLACLRLRRGSAAARHALWRLTLIALLCLPVFCALLPPWSAPLLSTPPPHIVMTVPAAQPSLAPIATHAPRHPAVSESPRLVQPNVLPAPAPVASPLPPFRLTPAEGVCLVWLLGACLVLGRTVIGVAAATRLALRCRPVPSGSLAAAMEEAARALRLRRLPSLRVGTVAVPMTCGWRHPIILLPSDAANWPMNRLRSALLHEAAHVRRGDWATLLLAQGVCALYWFHPLVWLAASRLRAEAEGACDDMVLSCGIPAPDYAAHLLEIVRGLTSRRAVAFGTVAMAHRSEVSVRLRTILDRHQPRNGVARQKMALAASAAILMLAPLAALHLVAAQPQKPVSQTLSWVETTHITDASGHQITGSNSQVVFWVRRNPPAVAMLNVPTPGSETLETTQGVFTRTIFGGHLVEEPPQPANHLSITHEVDRYFRQFLSFSIAATAAPKQPSATQPVFTPWQEKQGSLKGTPVQIFSREIHVVFHIKGSQKATIQIQDWTNPQNHHLLRGEQDVTVTGQGKQRFVVSVTHDIRNNPTPPPGVFDWTSRPGTQVIDSSWEMFTPAQMAALVAETKPWAVTLPNGVRVQVLTVNAEDTKGNAALSWTPDGKIRWQNKAITPVPGNFLIMCRITIPPQLQKSTGQIGLGRLSNQNYAVEGWPFPKTEIPSFFIEFPNRQVTGAVEVHVTLKPWTTLITASPTTGATRRLPTGETITVSKPFVTSFISLGHKVNTTEMVVTLPSRFIDDMMGYQFFPVGFDGKPLLVHHAGFSEPQISGKTARVEYDFRTSEMPLSRVKEFRFTVRPVDTAVIPNIALRPATRQG